MVREGDETSLWSRLHARQALVLGLIGSAIFVIVLALPLLTVIAVPSLSAAATISIYGIGLIVDIVAFIALLAVGLRCAARAARGDLFAIPLVSPIVDRLFRLKR